MNIKTVAHQSTGRGHWRLRLLALTLFALAITHASPAEAAGGVYVPPVYCYAYPGVGAFRVGVPTITAEPGFSSQTVYWALKVARWDGAKWVTESRIPADPNKFMQVTVTQTPYATFQDVTGNFLKDGYHRVFFDIRWWDGQWNSDDYWGLWATQYEMNHYGGHSCARGLVN